ncbi:MAG TPA: adenylate/guanylate cyclase domain-containing protein [Actinomycetota bacterium]|nr:adenylate/guanylate cyclase domain-containing protein [Actinomycetota bacterium]
MVDRSGGEVRKTVTVLFCDITGSTSLGEQLDPESLRSLMSRFFEEMQVVLERHGGTVEKYIGDAVMAVFGIPSVHEDDALRAVRAATEMRDSLASLNKELERDRGVAIQSRIGVNTGDVVAGDSAARQSLVTGDAVNVAARLEQAAGPGEILIGSPTMSLVRDAVIGEPVEPLTLKGKTGAVAAFRLVEVGRDSLGVTRRLDTPMVGRARELDALREAFARATADSSCVLATILGAPGVGKSRLVEEFLAGLPEESTIVRGQCLSYGDGITYWPVVEMLTGVASILDSDGPAEVRPKIDALLRGAEDAAIASERLAEFLGLAGATASPEETNWAIRKLFEALASDRPLIAAFEDIHWAEPGLLDLIEHVAEWTRDAPILLVCPARPELREVRPGWGGQAMATTLLLEPLSQNESDQLIAGLLGRSDTPLTVAARVMEAAEGNPLFVEQMVAMLIDDGLVRPETDGWVVTGDLSHLTVPPTIAGLLQARLDRLTPEEQRVIERGAVEGRVFHWGSVTDLSSDLAPGDVGRHLMALHRRDLIGPEQALFGGSEAFRFRHALIRDAAYERIPKRVRSQLHEGHARWLERIAAERLPEFEEVLAYHLEQAAALRSELGPLDDHGRELAGEAAVRLASGGRRAVARGDLLGASKLFDRAVALMDTDDPVRIDLLERLGTAAIHAGALERAKSAFDEASETSSRQGDRRREIRARLAQLLLRSQMEPEGATELLKREAEKAIPVLEELGDDEGLARAWSALSEVGLMWCRASDIETASERAAFHAQRAGDRAALPDVALSRMVAPFLGMARPEEGIQRCEEIRAWLPEDRFIGAMADMLEGGCLGQLGLFEEGRRQQRRALEVVLDLGQKLWVGRVSMNASWLEILAGDLEAAEGFLRRGMEMLGSIRELGSRSTLAADLAHVLYEQGRFEDAAEMIGVSENLGASDDLVNQVTARGIRAKLLAREERTEEAIAVVDEAVSMTKGIDFWDTLSGTFENLAEVYRLAGRRDDAIAALGRALDVCERKGAVPAVERIRAKLDAVG